MLLLFYYLAPLLNDCLMTSQCMQFTFGDKREVYLKDESALPVTKKESKCKGKMSIAPRMKYKHANHNSFCAQTNEWVCIFNLSSLFICHKNLYLFICFTPISIYI